LIPGTSVDSGSSSLEMTKKINHISHIMPEPKSNIIPSTVLAKALEPKH
jgi:hypothetical protein